METLVNAGSPRASCVMSLGFTQKMSRGSQSQGCPNNSRVEIQSAKENQREHTGGNQTSLPQRVSIIRERREHPAAKALGSQSSRWSDPGCPQLTSPGLERSRHFTLPKSKYPWKYLEPFWPKYILRYLLGPLGFPCAHQRSLDCPPLPYNPWGGLAEACASPPMAARLRTALCPIFPQKLGAAKSDKERLFIQSGGSQSKLLSKTRTSRIRKK